MAREVYRPVCAGKKESGGLHTPRVNDLKRNNERARWREGERGAGVCMHDRKLALASYKEKRIVKV